MIKDGWYCCPYCHKKLFKVKRNAMIKGVIYKCKSCREIININIEPMSLQDK